MASALCILLNIFMKIELTSTELRPLWNESCQKYLQQRKQNHHNATMLTDK